jgi:hypothetical protein
MLRIFLALWLALTPAFSWAGSMMLLGVGGPSAVAGCSFPTGIGLVARWRADVGVTVVGGNATSVADQSGNGNTITPVGTVALNPTGSAHGQPAFIFTGSNALAMAGLTANMGSGGSTVSAFVVGQVTDTLALGLLSLIGTAGATGNTDATSASLINFVIAGNQVRIQQNFGQLLNFSLSLNTQFRMGAFINGSTSANQFLNNTAGTPGALNYTQSATTQIVVGNQITSGVVSTTSGWIGPVSEVVVTNSILTTPQLNAIDTYFTCQWGS